MTSLYTLLQKYLKNYQLIVVILQDDLKRWRIEKGITLEEAAKFFETNASDYRKIEQSEETKEIVSQLLAYLHIIHNKPPFRSADDHLQISKLTDKLKRKSKQISELKKQVNTLTIANYKLINKIDEP